MTINANGNTVNIPIPNTVIADHDFIAYGGTLNVLTGELTVTKLGKVLDGTEGWAQTGTAGTNRRFYIKWQNMRCLAGSAYRESSHFPDDPVTSSTTNIGYYIYHSSSTEVQMNFRPDLSVIPNTVAWNNYLAAQYANGTPVTCWWELDPDYYITVQLTPEQINTILGSNNISADSGDVTVGWLS